MIDLTQIRSVTDFQRNAKDYVGKLRESKIPMVLTVNGRAELVVQDAISYQNLLNRLAKFEEEVEFETIAAIRVGLKQASEGKVKPARTALRQLGGKLGL